MSLNPEYTKAPVAPKRPMSGIGASNSAARLVDVLTGLGLCTPELAAPLRTIAAAGRPLGEFYKVNLHELDRALDGIEASTTNKMAFKNSLDIAGLLHIPK